MSKILLDKSFALEKAENQYYLGIIDEQTRNKIIKFINALPPAQPEQKRGRWVKHDTGHSIYYVCSLCGCVAPCTEVSDSFIWKLSAYCPDCGADMRCKSDETD